MVPLYEQQTDPDFRNKWGTAFCYGVETVMLTAFTYLRDKRQESESINVLIEDGHKNAGQAIDHLTAVVKQGGIVNIKTCGKGGKVDHPILQAADMLAYSEWKYLSQTGREIFDAINDNSRPYRTYLFDCDEDLIASSKRGVQKFISARKEFGQRTRLPHSPTPEAGGRL